MCGVLGSLVLVHWRVRVVRCVCDFSGHLALFTGVRAFSVLCAVSMATWRLFTVVPAQCVVCAVSLATRRLFTRLRARCAVCVVSLATWH